MNLDRPAEILDKTLQEEEETDALLTEIAEANINIEADQENYSWSGKEETAMEYEGSANSF